MAEDVPLNLSKRSCFRRESSKGCGFPPSLSLPNRSASPKHTSCQNTEMKSKCLFSKAKFKPSSFCIFKCNKSKAAMALKEEDLKQQATPAEPCRFEAAEALKRLSLVQSQDAGNDCKLIGPMDIKTEPSCSSSSSSSLLVAAAANAKAEQVLQSPTVKTEQCVVPALMNKVFMTSSSLSAAPICSLPFLKSSNLSVQKQTCNLPVTFVNNTGYTTFTAGAHPILSKLVKPSVSLVVGNINNSTCQSTPVITPILSQFINQYTKSCPTNNVSSQNVTSSVLNTSTVLTSIDSHSTPVPPALSAKGPILMDTRPSSTATPPPKNMTPPPSTGTPPPGEVSKLAMLPPCRVCGEKSSGYHYGVNTCEACKGFFRRCLLRKIPNKCPSKTGCLITPGKKYSYCSTCRWKKCLSVGMSKNAIKTGRYTSETRTRNIEQVKQLELQAKMKEDGTLVYSREERAKELERLIQTIASKHVQLTSTLPSQSHLQDMNCSLQYMDHAIKHCVGFAKALPGFDDLPKDDQIALIKASRKDNWLLRFCHSQGTEDEGTLDPNNPLMLLRGEAIQMLVKGEQDRHKLWTMVDRMQALELTTEEQAMVAALAISIADAEVSHVGQVILSACQDYMSEAMLHLIKINHSPAEKTFVRLVSILTELRSTPDIVELYTHHMLSDQESTLKQNLGRLVETT